MEEQLNRKEERKERKMRGNFARKGLLWGGVFALFGAGAWAMVGLVPEAPALEPGADIPAVVLEDHAWGLETASVTLVEYGDFQCPACGSYFPVIQRLKEGFPDSLRIVFRQFPLRGIHPFADVSARASEAAALQGKFWEMHDMLFERQREWTADGDVRARLAEYAEELGLDTARFSEDLDSPGVRDKVERDTLGGNAAKVQGTPTFFLQGKRIQNPRSYDEFKSLVEQAIQQIP
ncbi:MAG: DsbA family protein [Candidatus Wildermuthbacteria bacterium]|nr:DsbA family protein [Candidatus Wildermuthbacteria bacterium]